jgi:DNA-binding XRE family transcriptional regulator
LKMRDFSGFLLTVRAQCGMRLIRGSSTPNLPLAFRLMGLFESTIERIFTDGAGG